jgi:hypothetical protein
MSSPFGFWFVTGLPVVLLHSEGRLCLVGKSCDKKLSPFSRALVPPMFQPPCSVAFIILRRRFDLYRNFQAFFSGKTCLLRNQESSCKIFPVLLQSVFTQEVFRSKKKYRIFFVLLAFLAIWMLITGQCEAENSESTCELWYEVAAVKKKMP